MTTRAAGFLIAGVTLAGVLAVIAWSQLRPDPAGEGDALPGVAASPPPPLTGRPPVDPESIQELIAEADQGRIELVDEQNRVIQELLYTAFSPQEAGRFHVTNPQAWLYVDDTRTITIDAEALSFIQPRGSREPEKGRFSGAVRVRLFESDGVTPAPRAGDDLDALALVPVATVLTDSLVFDTSIGELSTADPVEITASGLDASFTGFSVVIDERRKRLAYLRTDRSGRVRITPDELRSSSGASDRAGATPGEERAPAIEHYRAEFKDRIRVTADGRELAADVLELWAEFVDGALRDDAIATYTPTDGRPEGKQGAQPAPAGEGGESLTLTWEGSLIVRPLDSRPQELGPEAVALRFTAPVTGAVALNDDQSGAAARSGTLEYGLTSRQLVLSGAGPSGVTVRIPGSAEMLAGRAELNLASGLGAIPGPGVVRVLDAAPDAADRRITWERRSEFTLATRDGQIDFASPALLREAVFEGGADARYAGSFVRGEFIRAVLAANPAGEPTLTRVIVEGGARADAGADGSLAAQRIDVAFDPEADSPVPTLVTAEGQVRAVREGSSLEAELVEAHIVQVAAADGATDLRVSTLRADLGVVARTPAGEEVSADQLRADIAAGVFDLTGKPVVMRREGAAITGGAMRIEEREQRLTVFGAGMLNYARASGVRQGYDRAQIEWSRTLLYDGVAGTVEIVGDCWATAELDEFSRDHARADRVLIDLADDASNIDPQRRDAPLAAARTVSRVQLFAGDDDDARAEVESRQYARDEASATGLRLESIVFLSAPSIDADVESDSLVVPHSGRLLIDDRRESEARPDAQPLAGDIRGTALFEWEGDFTMSRRTGEAAMRRAVRLRHLPPGASVVTDLECEQLTAGVRFPEQGEGGAGLRSAIAAGAVYVRRDTRQLIADRLEYDADAGIAQATSAPGNVVTIFDTTRPTPLTGAVLRWDLIRDRLEWRDAGETSTPR